MSEWSIDRLLNWASRKNRSSYVSKRVRKVVDKIFDVYGPKEEIEEKQELSEQAKIRLEGDKTLEDALQQVRNYYLVHKDENDDLDLILRQQKKVNFSPFSLLVDFYFRSSA